MNTSKTIRRLRKERNLSQERLAQEVGTQQTHVSAAERGAYVPQNQLKKIVDYLGIRTGEFIIVHTDNERYAIDMALAFVFGGLFGSGLMFLTFLI